jgi:molybdopterin/thiamine biosynthesis adenylyltransferase
VSHESDIASSTGRYHRQMLLPDFGPERQEQLENATVLVVGCGALGCGVADQLARAGVGTIRIVDRDIVEQTNLQRQVLYCQADADASRPKAMAAADRLRAINPTIDIEPVVDDFRASNAEDITAGMSLLIDGLDNFDTRYLLNDIAVKHGLPYIYAGAVGTGGLVMPILPRSIQQGRSITWSSEQSTPCLRCIFPEPAPPGSTPTCDTAGILGPTIAAVTAQQAAIALSLLIGRIDGIDRSMHSIDPWTGDDRRMQTGTPRDDCPCCHDHVFEWLEGNRERQTEALCGRDTVQILPAMMCRVDLEAVATRLVKHGRVHYDEHALRVDLADHAIRMTIFPDGRALIGVADPIQARTLYDRFVGS